MDALKDKIKKILYDNSTEEKSSTGTTGEIIIYAPFEDIIDEIIKIIKTEKNIYKEDNFEESARHLMKYLGENHHPHTSAYVTNNRAELLEGKEGFGTEDYVLD